MTFARFLGGPRHGQRFNVGDCAPDQWLEPAQAPIRPILDDTEPQLAPMPEPHRYRHAVYSVKHNTDDLTPPFHFHYYLYEGPSLPSAVAAFLYAQDLNSSEPVAPWSEGPRGPRSDEIRQYEELATRVPEPGTRRFQRPEQAEHWLRVMATEFRDKPGYRPEWAPEPDSVRSLRALHAVLGTTYREESP
jgi:hypothetical protein